MGEMDKLEKLGELASYVHKSNFMPEFMTIYSIAESCWKLFHVMLGLAVTAPYN